ncbi:MAG: helix-turn-helix domain-containing protein [Vitreoscilla sp.]|nr:helix-turn-helix domain-containing protein [Vitreoscilla sp.]
MKASHPAPALPAFQLYGEHGATFVAERLHVETITARSRLHDWEIRPHRHEILFQILYIAGGRAEAHLDGRAVPLAGPAAVTVPAAAAHGFAFEPGIDGLVVTVQEPHVRQVLAAEPGLWSLFERSRVLLWGSAGARAQGDPRPVGAAARALASEFAGHRTWRAAAIDAGLVQLLLALARALPAEEPALGGPQGRAQSHLARYRALVDARFRLQPSVADLTAELGITATQLNRVCQAVLGRSALGLLHARMALEAQRQLAYTTLSVKRIGMDLGFADPGYFTRFFQRLCGVSPTAWRAQSRTR